MDGGGRSWGLTYVCVFACFPIICVTRDSSVPRLSIYHDNLTSTLFLPSSSSLLAPPVSPSSAPVSFRFYVAEKSLSA